MKASRDAWDALHKPNKVEDKDSYTDLDDINQENYKINVDKLKSGFANNPMGNNKLKNKKKMDSKTRGK